MPKTAEIIRQALARGAIVIAVAAGALVAGGSAPATATGVSDTPKSIGQRFVPADPITAGGVSGAFGALSQKADELAFATNGTPKPTECKHIEGIARKDGPDGTPYLFYTKSGLDPGAACFVDDEPGYLIVARMGSRNHAGERMGTNLLPYNTPSEWTNLADDKAVTAIPMDGEHGIPAYRHPGGMQILGNVLAVGTENPFGGERARATILFFDITDPENPTLTSRFNPLDPDTQNNDFNKEFGADPVGLTAIRAEDGACCRYLLVAAGGPANKDVRFFRSLPDAGKTTTTLSSPSLGWELAGRFTESQLEACPGLGDWPEGSGPFDTGQHQMLNFVREGDIDGRLFLIGGRRTGAIINPFSDEKLDLYEVHLDSSGIPDACPLTHVRSKTMDQGSWASSQYAGSFSAGSSTYVSPSGELLVYVSNHDANGDRIFAGEYRIGSFVRANSPTLRPSADFGGPYAVDEGSRVTLTGQARPPVTKAFVQLFYDTKVGLDTGAPPWFPIEFDTRDEDHFDSLDRLATRAVDINEQASSWRWFAPPGCTISANDYSITSLNSDEYPGPDTVQLRGTGRFEEALDLGHLPVYRPAGSPYPVSPVPAGVTPTIKDYNDDVGGVTFYEVYRDADGNLVRDHRGCESYYAKHYTIGWDLDANGSFESDGDSVGFSAATIDGPKTATVNARAKHPVDTSLVGTGPTVSLPVQVRNVPPQIASASVKDSLGHDLDGGATPTIVGLPVTLAATFTDPGVADTQSASIDWGDGSPLDTSFTSFSDAYGGATGQIRDSHVYATPGTRTITVTVTDDDGGVTTRRLTVTVLSLVDAIKGVADTLTQLIQSATSTSVASALRAARDELIGNLGGTPPKNGATDKLDANDPSAAITKLKAAISDLLTAESRGAGDLSSLKDTLGLVAEGIATASYQQARAAIPSPSPGQAKTLATIAELIRSGHDQLAAKQYLGACDSFRAATDKAPRLG